MGKRIRKRLKIQGPITANADKGLYNGEDLYRCKKNKIVAIVAKQKAGRNTQDSAYSADKFVYLEGEDACLCPAGHKLSRTGTKAARAYANKKACAGCEHRADCTRGKYRRVSFSHYTNILKEVDARTQANPEIYAKRQMMVEHPFGTIKRSMNGGYFLLRTFKKVRGEVALLFFAYNLKRAINILGNKGIEAGLAAHSLILFLFLRARIAKRLLFSS